MPTDGLTLGFDTSAAHCAAALLSGERVIAARFETMPRGQAERLMPLIAELLDGAGMRWGDIARIGVGVGPGNFTGVRIAVAAARGLALGVGCPAIGVSGFDALRDGQGGTVLASIDARRGQCHLAAGDAPPLTAAPEALPEALIGSGRDVVGHLAEALAAQTGGQARMPRDPLAVAISRIAARASLPAPRPAPLYMRAPDAAPAASPPPVLLP